MNEPLTPSVSNVRRSVVEPHDRLTHLGDLMICSLVERGDSEMRDVDAVAVLRQGRDVGVATSREMPGDELCALLLAVAEVAARSVGKTLKVTVE